MNEIDGMEYIAEPLRSLAVPIETLHPDGANLRTHDERNIRSIAASLARFGQRAPLVVQRQGMVVRAGNARLQAAQSLGWSHVAAIVVDEEDVSATAFAIADNRTAELAGWDDAELIRTLAALKCSLPDSADLDLMFSRDEIADMERACHAQEGQTDPDDVPDPPAEPITKPGDLWILGEHRLLCGDSTVATDVERLMAGEKALVMATDPPYGVAYDNAQRPNPGVAKPRVAKPRVANDELTTGPEMQEFLECMLRAALPHMDPHAAFYFWHPMLMQGTYVASASAAAGILIHRQIIWVKACLLLGHGDYHWRHELCFYGWQQGNRPPWYGQRNQDTIWEVASVSQKERKEMNHATPKPTELWTKPIENHTRPNGVLYEPFSGSGTQIIAAERHRRRCFAMELEPRYVDVAIARWEAFTGRKAVLEATPCR